MEKICILFNEQIDGKNSSEELLIWWRLAGNSSNDENGYLQHEYANWIKKKVKRNGSLPSIRFSDGKSTNSGYLFMQSVKIEDIPYHASTSIEHSSKVGRKIKMEINFLFEK